MEDGMAKPVIDRIEKDVKSAFPDDAVERVQVLDYGDDPEVEPGEVAIRIFVSRSGRPEGEEANKDVLHAFEEANGERIKELREHLPRFIGWIEFRSEREDTEERHHGPVMRMRLGGRGGRTKTLDDLSEELTPVMTRLGTADLATVDTLIAAGFANSRAEVLRWAVGRIRENPTYTQLQERMHDINALKAQF
jgi:hypothetical protein